MILLLLLAMGFGISFDVDRLFFAVDDQDRTPESRAVIDEFASIRQFELQEAFSGPAELNARIGRGDLTLALEIPDGSGRSPAKGETPEVSLNVLSLAVMKLRAIRRDKVMTVLMIYVFTVAILIVSNGASTEVRGVSVAVVDEDRSQHSGGLIDAIQPPLFAEPALVSSAEAARGQTGGEYILAISIPLDFERGLSRPDRLARDRRRHGARRGGFRAGEFRLPPPVPSEFRRHMVHRRDAVDEQRDDLGADPRRLGS